MIIEKPLALITGGSKGIGRETAELFLKNHYEVINISRSPCDNPSVQNILIDLIETDEMSIQQTLLQHISTKRRMVFIHNASVCFNDTIETLNKTKWNHTLKLNLTLPALLTQCLLPTMKAQSAIIFVGSTLSEKAVRNTCSYTVSKHGLVGLMRSVCQDLAGKHIHTCCVCPGITDTAMLRGRIGENTALLKTLAAIQSDNRLLTPQEMAEIIFVAATHPVFNGAVLHANGGQIER